MNQLALVTPDDFDRATGGPAAALVSALLGVGALPDDPVAWRLAVPLLRYHRLEGLALARADETAAAVPSAARAALEPAARRTALQTTLTLEAARRARDALDRAGMATLLIKGAALVEGGLYPSAGARRMDDADLLVRPREAARAAVALEAAGFRPWSAWSPERAIWLDSATFADRSAPAGLPVTIDLHWRTAYGALRFGECGRDDGLAWKGRAAAPGLPSHEAHLLLVAEHLLKHLRFRAHLLGFADLARLVRRVDDWDAVVGWGGGRPMAGGVAALLASLRSSPGAPVPEGVPEALAGRRRVRSPRVLRPETLFGRESPVRGRVRGLLLRWRLQGGLAVALADAAHAALPTPAWLRARYGEDARTTAGRWLLYAGDAARWLAGGGRSPASPNQDLAD